MSGLLKNTASQKWRVFAFDRTTNAPVTGDAANITAKIAKDWGSATATNDTNPTEVEDGFYLFDLTQAETNANWLDLYPESSTSDVQVIGVPGSMGTIPSGFQTQVAQTGDTYAIVNSGTHGNAALKTLIDAVDNFVDTEIADIQSRLPAALVSGRMDSNMQAAANNVITAAVIATGAIDRDALAADTGLQTIRSGTAQAGGSSSITLDASASSTDDFYKGAIVYLTGGTGAGQARFIPGYTGSTKVASIFPGWATNPNSSTTFAILPWGAVDFYSIQGSSSAGDGLTSMASDFGTYGRLAARLPDLEIARGVTGLTGNDTTHIHLSTLTQGDDELNDYLIFIRDLLGGEYHARWIEDWDGTSKLATVAELPWTPNAEVDEFVVWAIRKGTSPAVIATLATAAELAKVPKSDGTATWNATALASINSQCDTALADYDGPTNAEMVARTLAAASYATAAALDAVDNYIDTEIGALTTAVADLPTNSELATALAAADDAVLAAIATAQNDLDVLTGTDGVTLATSQPNYAPATSAQAVAIQGATFDTSTDSLEAIRNRGDAAWTTATGFSTLDAAGVRTAVGLASANLDTQLADLPTVAEFEARSLVAADYFVVGDYTAPPSAASIRAEIDSNSTQLAAIVADTNELQTDWANGGRLDLIVDAILVDTAEIGAAGAGLTEAGGTGDQFTAIPWNAAWDAEVQSEVADALAVYDPPTHAELLSAHSTTDALIGDVPTNAELAAAIITGLTTALAEGYRSTGATGSVRDMLYELLAHMGNSGIAGVTKTLKKLDKSTTAKTFTLDDATTPTAIEEAS